MKITKQEFFELWEKVKAQFYLDTNLLAVPKNLDRLAYEINKLNQNNSVTSKYLKNKLKVFNDIKSMVAMRPRNYRALKNYSEKNYSKNKPISATKENQTVLSNNEKKHINIIYIMERSIAKETEEQKKESRTDIYKKEITEEKVKEPIITLNNQVEEIAQPNELIVVSVLSNEDESSRNTRLVDLVGIDGLPILDKDSLPIDSTVNLKAENSIVPNPEMEEMNIAEKNIVSIVNALESPSNILPDKSIIEPVIITTANTSNNISFTNGKILKLVSIVAIASCLIMVFLNSNFSTKTISKEQFVSSDLVQTPPESVITVFSIN